MNKIIPHNDFMPSRTPLLKTVYDKTLEKLSERDRDSFDENISTECSQLYISLIYSNIVRVEYANEKIRETHSLLREDKHLYRHKIKQHYNALRMFMAKYDQSFADIFNQLGNLDYFDKLCTHCFKHLDRLYLPFYYSSLQFATSHSIPYDSIVAAFECAYTLMEYAHHMMQADIERYVMKVPAIRCFPLIFRTKERLAMMDAIHHLIAKQATQGLDGQFDINQDKNTMLAKDNLFRALASADAINEFTPLDESDIR